MLRHFSRLSAGLCDAQIFSITCKVEKLNILKAASIPLRTFTFIHSDQPPDWASNTSIFVSYNRLFARKTAPFSGNSRLYIHTAMTENKYCADYAKTARSSCKKCKQKIEKAELRIAKVTANFFHDGDGEMKQYHHPKCIFETFVRARATTKIIQEPDDLEGFGDLEQDDKDFLNKLIAETMAKKGPAKTPKKKPAAQNKAPKPSPAKKEEKKPAPSAAADTPPPVDIDEAVPSPVIPPPDEDEDTQKDNAFRNFRRLCADVADENSYTGKSQLVSNYINKGSSGAGYKGDLYLLVKLLLPGVVKTVYNLNSKQLVKIFSQIFGVSLDKMVEDLEQGDVAETVRSFFEENTVVPPLKKSVLSIPEINFYLEELSKYTKEDDHQRVLTKITKRCTGNDLKMAVRLIKKDLRINAGAKHILDGLDANAYQAFQMSRDLKDVVTRVQELKRSPAKPGMGKKLLSIKASVMTPVLPMLAEACRSVEFAFKRCKSGMYAEIKYDGERVQVHKKGDTFQYFSRSLKPVLPHKVLHFEEFIPKAFPHGNDIILDSEVLLVDTNTGNPLPFGTLGVHKKAAFKDACVCLFIFDCIHFNGENLMEKPIKERRQFLYDNMTEIPNRILFSEMTHVTKPDQLQGLMSKVFKEGLEGLVLKDVMGPYEPGKRHWLKVKKDYLEGGAMADSADLVVLGAYFGTGKQGGIMSIFLMGVYDPDGDRWCTVTKCHSGFDDKTLDKLQKELDMVKISKDQSKIPPWLHMNKALAPDYIARNPKKSPVWEITGAEFTKAKIHTADGISIRFPRCTKMRDDKSWKEATDLPRLKVLFQKSNDLTDIKEKMGSNAKLRKQGSKGSQGDEEDMDTETSDNGNGNHGNGVAHSNKPQSHAITPQKRKAEADIDESPAKREKTEDKPECKYGAGCYQQSPDHKRQFYHPSSKKMHTSTNQSKHLPDVFKGMKIFVPDSVDKCQLLKRYITAYDGDVISDFDKGGATHVVSSKSQNKGAGATTISADWLWKCIKRKTIIPIKNS